MRKGRKRGDEGRRGRGKKCLTLLAFLFLSDFELLSKSRVLNWKDTVNAGRAREAALVPG